jgi:hypothetical protein
MNDQTNRGSSHQLNKLNLSLNKTNEKLDLLIELLTKLLKDKSN